MQTRIWENMAPDPDWTEEELEEMEYERELFEEKKAEDRYERRNGRFGEEL
jgi:hypothetical protein